LGSNCVFPSLSVTASTIQEKGWKRNKEQQARQCLHESYLKIRSICDLLMHVAMLSEPHGSCTVGMLRFLHIAIRGKLDMDMGIMQTTMEKEHEREGKGERPPKYCMVRDDVP